MSEFNLEGADRITIGTSDVTMRIWKRLDASGEQGLTRGELLELEGPHINRGYARRRYLAQRKRHHRHSVARAGVRETTFALTPAPTWETTELEPALNYVITRTLIDMRRWGSAIQLPDGRHIAGRKPRYYQDEQTLDMTGDRTRLHMNTAETLRLLESFIERRRESPRAQLSSREFEALVRNVELDKEAMRLGFKGVE